jgi:hypothetical protein
LRCSVLQALFAFPSLDKKHDLLDVNYTIETYMRTVQPILAAHRRLMASFASHVAKLDGGFKVCARGLVTFMTAEGLIAGQWLGTGSLWDLAGPLTALSLRFKFMGKVSRPCPRNPALQHPNITAPIHL